MPSYTTITVAGYVTSENDPEATPSLPLCYFAALPVAPGWVILYPESVLDVPNVVDLFAALASRASKGANVVLATVDDEEALRLRFFLDGDPVDEYLTEPGLADGEELPPSGGDASQIASLFGVTDSETVRELSEIFGAAKLDEIHGFTEARERHGEIAHLLNLPSASVGVGYESLQRGKMPEDVSGETLRHYTAKYDGFVADNKIRQYALYRPKEGETDAAVAARFLPDVISWEDDFLGDAAPEVGTVEEVRQQIAGVLPDSLLHISTRWISITDDHGVVEIDFGNEESDRGIDSIRIFTLGITDPSRLFAHLCDGMPWAIWSHESRRTVYRSAATAG